MTEPAESREPAEEIDPPPIDPPLDPVVDEAGELDPEEPRRYPSTIGGAFYLAVLVGALTGLGITVDGDWRVGVRVIGVGLGAAAVLRLVLPQRDAGMLAVRHRVVDVLMLAAVGGVLWWLAGSIPDQPPL